jgi:hypothetical protein
MQLHRIIIIKHHKYSQCENASIMLLCHFESVGSKREGCGGRKEMVTLHSPLHTMMLKQQKVTKHFK